MNIVSFFLLWLVGNPLCVALITHFGTFEDASIVLYACTILIAVGIVQSIVLYACTKRTLLRWAIVSSLGGIVCTLMGMAIAISLSILGTDMTYSVVVGISVGWSILGALQGWTIGSYSSSISMAATNAIASSITMLYLINASLSFPPILIEQGYFAHTDWTRIATISGAILAFFQGIGLVYILNFLRERKGAFRGNDCFSSKRPGLSFTLKQRHRSSRFKLLSLMCVFGIVIATVQTAERVVLNSLLLGANLPSAKEKDFYYERTMSGPEGAFCAKISNAGFLAYVDKINEMYEVGAEGGLSAASFFRKGNPRIRELDCWVYDESAAVERYTLRLGDDSAIIAYQNGVMYVVRDSN